MTGTGQQFALFDARAPAPEKKEPRKPREPAYTPDPALKAEYLPSSGDALLLPKHYDANGPTPYKVTAALCKRLEFIRTHYYGDGNTLYAVFRDGPYRDEEFEVYAIPVSRLEKV